jgi:hypothetical protein
MVGVANTFLFKCMHVMVFLICISLISCFGTVNVVKKCYIYMVGVANTFLFKCMFQ